MKPRALVLAPMRGAAWERFQELAEVVYEPGAEPYPARELADRLAELRARVLITERDEVRGPVLDQPLLAVGCPLDDLSHVDLAAATARRVPVLCAPGRDGDAVAEFALSLLLAVSRRLVVADRMVRQGLPYAMDHKAWELAGRTIGILGHGAAAQALAWRMTGLRMRVVSQDSGHSVDTVLAVSDMVVVISPGVPVDFGLMKPGAVLVHTAAPYDLEGLVGALKTGHLGGAALDRPVEPRHPLADMDNVVLAPGIGGATYDTELNQSRMICEDLVRIFGGETPVHCANPEALAGE
ncbi:NAD(P)-dependent oxidoreductase [Nonomuraea sp. NPDC046570]|uniref:NAD(P)-dependent oxidoreductase n=1 Tax=Nonomuraea sp. NPDC046570 TaxID=3155255 RepID=UPI0034040D8D